MREQEVMGARVSTIEGPADWEVDPVKKYLVLLAIIVMALPLAACSPRIQSVAACPDQSVYGGTYLADILLPAELEVTLSDGTTKQVPVAWDIAAWLGKPLQESIIVSGKAEGVKEPVTVQVVVMSKTAAMPSLTEPELTSGNIAALMTERMAADPRLTGVTWSSNRAAVVFTLQEEGPLYIWSVGEAAPQEVLPTNFYHQLAWSFDNQYLCVHVYPSLGEHAARVISYPSLTFTPYFQIVNQTYWSPDSNELLMAKQSSVKAAPDAAFAAYLTDLALFNAETGETRILVQAEPKATCFPNAWKAPGVVTYRKGSLNSFQELELSLR